MHIYIRILSYICSKMCCSSPLDVWLYQNITYCLKLIFDCIIYSAKINFWYFWKFRRHGYYRNWHDISGKKIINKKRYDCNHINIWNFMSKFWYNCAVWLFWNFINNFLKLRKKSIFSSPCCTKLRPINWWFIDRNVKQKPVY